VTQNKLSASRLLQLPVKTKPQTGCATNTTHQAMAHTNAQPASFHKKCWTSPQSWFKILQQSKFNVYMSHLHIKGLFISQDSVIGERNDCIKRKN